MKGWSYLINIFMICGIKFMTTKNKIVLGADLSLTGTGIVVLNNGKLIKKQLIKSKPYGNKPLDELNRILKIVKNIELIINECNPEIVVIENLAFMVHNTTSLTQLSGLSYFVRSMIADKGIPFIYALQQL